MEQIRRSLYCIGQLIWIQIWIQIDERCAGSSFLFNGFRRFGRVDSSIQVPPSLLICRDQKCWLSGISDLFAFGKYENTRREDFLLDENNASVLWLVKRYTKHAAGTL